MVFWIIFLVMLAGAILTVLLPLSRGNKDDIKDVDALDIYRQQLSDLDEREASTAQGKEALEIQRTEIARRILKESRRTKSAHHSYTRSKFGRVASSVIALTILPLISLGIYFTLGSPGTPDSPLADQRIGKLEDKSIEEMVRMAEKHLAKNPDDARGWTVVANVYGRLNRPSDRARAFEQIIRIQGPTPGSLAELGEALTVADGNIVSARARKLFETAWNQDKTTLKASVYLALALEQEGRFDLAIKRWNDLSKNRLDDPQWQAMTKERLAANRMRMNKGKDKGPTAEDVNNASKMSAEDRKSMIAGMVEQLAEKIREDKTDYEGWVKLIRSYSVLKRTNDVAFTLSEARIQFKDDAAKLAKLETLARRLKIPEPVE